MYRQVRGQRYFVVENRYVYKSRFHYIMGKITYFLGLIIFPVCFVITEIINNPIPAGVGIILAFILASWSIFNFSEEFQIVGEFEFDNRLE